MPRRRQNGKGPRPRLRGSIKRPADPLCGLTMPVTAELQSCMRGRWHARHVFDGMAAKCHRPVMANGKKCY